MLSFRSLFRASDCAVQDAASMSEPGSQPDPTQLWRRTVFQTWPLGPELSAVQVGSPDAVHVFPSPSVEWVTGCTEWASLEEHLERYRDRHPYDTDQQQCLLDVLPKLMEAGLLVSESEVQGWCQVRPAAQAERSSISAIGFPTGGIDGLELVPRAVRSFAENARDYGRSVDLLVCDSSQDPALREQYRARLRVLSSHLGRPIRYGGGEEKQQFARELISLGACSPEVADFALGDPLGTGFAPGANRNMMLLDQAGAMFCSVDHDVLCRATRSPEPSATSLSLFSQCDPFARWSFANRAEADRTTRWETPDHLGLHESMLGCGLHELIPGDGSASLDFRRAEDTLLQRLKAGPTRVRATFCGHSGEPGVPGAAYYLAYRGANRARLTTSEEHYRASLANVSLLALSPNPAIGDASLSPGVAFGMDHRELLPPFFPVLHAEDFSWSALAWQCCPGMVLGLLPWAVAHEPFPGKLFLQIGDLASLPPFVVWEWAHMLRFWTMVWQPAATAGASERIHRFGRLLQELASLSQEDFAAELRRAALAMNSHQIAFYDSELHSADEATPDYWRNDVETYLNHLKQAVTRPGFEIPLDLQQRCRSLDEARALARKLTARYADVLIEWPDMVAAATEIRKRGGMIGAL